MDIQNRVGPVPRSSLSSLRRWGREGVVSEVWHACAARSKSNKMRTEKYHLAHALVAQWDGGAGVLGYQRVRTDKVEFLSPVSPPSLPALRR